jgi:hypothetical protein
MRHLRPLQSLLLPVLLSCVNTGCLKANSANGVPGGGAVALVRVPLTFEPQSISEPPLEDEAAATKSFSADVRAALHAPSSNK